MSSASSWAAEVVAGGRHEAEITWTTHGVPHVVADDFAGLGFGQGWACARDHFAGIVDHVVKVRSERARHLGAGEGDKHLHSDLGYLALDVRRRAADAAARQPAEIVDMVGGYAAGVNAWFAEHGRDALPAWCRDASWIGPIEPLDLFGVYVDLAIIASGRNLVEYIGSAAPPGADEHEAPPPPPPEPLVADPGLASNGWAFGGDATATGRGLVMANPHFPWWGEGRFWECHLRIPGALDVYGASLVGVPFVQIGFNQHVAWTHTFSRGSRFTVYKLDLTAGDATRYRYGDDERTMASRSHTVDVLGADGEVRSVTRRLWSSHNGPMLNLPLVGWGDTTAFSYRDANIDNDRFMGQVLAMNRAGGMDDLQAAVAEHQGLPWVNTMAADDTGRCWYIDASSTPKLSDDAQDRFEAALDGDLFTAMLYEMRVALLDGSDPTFEWLDDPAAVEPGLTPYDELPQLERRDHVFNANDPYWLPHATEQIVRHQALCGRYRRPVSPRTRMNARLAGGTGPVSPTGPGGTWTRDDAVAAVLGNHSLMAELVQEALVERLRAAEVAGRATVTLDGEDVDLTGTADLLAAWDGRYELDSVGAVVFREWLASFTPAELADAGTLFAIGFDPAAPVVTPHSLAPAPDEGPDPVLAAMARALRALTDAGVAADAALGSVQYVERGGRRVPLHGGFECEGIANVIAPIGTLARADLEPGPAMPPAVPGRTERTGLHQGGYPAVYGVSFLMSCAFGDDGPDAVGLLVYGQSGDPASPHHTDQLDDFAAKRLRPLRFTDEAIAADPDRSHRTVSG